MAVAWIAAAARAELPFDFQARTALATELAASIAVFEVPLAPADPALTATPDGGVPLYVEALAVAALDTAGNTVWLTSGPVVAEAAPAWATRQQLLGDGAIARLSADTPKLKRLVRARAVAPLGEVRRVAVVTLPAPEGAFDGQAPVLGEVVVTPADDVTVPGLALVTPALPLGCPLFDAEGHLIGLVFRPHPDKDHVWAVTGEWLRDALRPEGPPWDPPPPPPPPAPGLRGPRGQR